MPDRSAINPRYRRQLGAFMITSAAAQAPLRRRYPCCGLEDRHQLLGPKLPQVPAFCAAHGHVNIEPGIVHQGLESRCAHVEHKWNM